MAAAGSGGSEAASLRAGTYASALFAQFVTAMDPLRRVPELLDLGTTTPQNIMFWAERGFRVAAVDGLSHLPGRIEVPGEALFGGILCWNVLSALGRDEAIDLVTRLRHRLAPGGALFAIFDGDGRQAPHGRRYRIVGPDRLSFEPLTREVQLRAVPNSEIESLLRGLRPTRLTVMRHGSREALGFVDEGREREG